MVETVVQLDQEAAAPRPVWLAAAVTLVLAVTPVMEVQADLVTTARSGLARMELPVVTAVPVV